MPLVRADSWKKPRGVVKVVSAFGGKKSEKKDQRKGTEGSWQRQRQKEKARREVGSDRVTSKARLEVVDERGKKGADRSPGILRRDQGGKRPPTGGSGVRFSAKNEVKLIQVKPEEGSRESGSDSVRTKVERTRSTSPGDMRRQSRNILNNLNRKHEAKLRQAAAGYESESSYHSDCGHKSPIRRRPVGKKGAQARKRYGESKDKFKRRIQSEQRQEDESDADYERRMRSLEKETSDKHELGIASKLSQGMKSKSRGAAKWAKLKLLMLLSRSLDKDGGSSLLLMMHGGESLKGAAQFAKMTTKFGDLKEEVRGSVPRGGGPRLPGSFDTVARYQQHKTPKRFDPLSEIFVHTTQVRWHHYRTPITPEDSRDPKSVNSSIRLPWDKLVAEPVDVRAMTSRCSCWFGVVRCNVRAPWDILHDIFYGVSGCVYRSMLLFTILNAFVFGIYFGVLAFLHIWVVRPLQAMLRIQGAMLRMFIQVILGEAITSIVHVLREIFSTREVDIETLGTDLNGIFLRKEHWPGVGINKRGKMKRRCLGAYPQLHHLALPLTKPIWKGQKAKQGRASYI